MENMSATKNAMKKPAMRDLKKELRTTTIKFQKACEQMNLLNKQLSDIAKRMKLAKASGDRRTVYNLQLRASVTEGIRAAFYEYVYMRAEDVTMLRREVKYSNWRKPEVEEVEDSDSEDEEGEEEMAWGPRHN